MFMYISGKRRNIICCELEVKAYDWNICGEDYKISCKKQEWE